MRKFLLALFLGAFVIFGAGAYCGKSSNPASSAPVSTSNVSIKNMAFEPQNIEVAKGTTVVWTNNDSTVHQVESDGNLPDLLSGELQPGDTYDFVFDQSGTYAYHCKIHPQMTGQVIVQ